MRRASASSRCPPSLDCDQRTIRAVLGRLQGLGIDVGGTKVVLVVEGEPEAGARGQAITRGAPPVELVASGPALARRAGVERAEAVLGDPAWDSLVDGAAAALGQVLAVLVNALDPELVVI